MHTKIYIISENIVLENGETWIIDTFKKEFECYSNMIITNNYMDADIIWILGNNRLLIDEILAGDLNNKCVVTTVHHIDSTKINEFMIFFNKIHNITNKFHVICPKVHNDLIKLTDKEITTANFWINDSVFYHINDKKSLREKYDIPVDSYLIGSFQRDTEGKNKCMKPKLSKGPDIFCNIVEDINKKKDNLLVILAGRRRNYVIDRLEKMNVQYKYFEMVSNKELNELYNILDLYIVSSRVEGGPRSIIECGISKIPIISTDVGISELILDEKSIYDVNNFITYENAIPNVDHAYINSTKYTIDNYMKQFCENVFNVNK